MRAFLILIIAITYLNSCSCNRSPSSTGNILKGNTELYAIRTRDTTDVHTLMAKVSRFHYSDWDSAMVIYKEALLICDEIHYTDGKGWIYSNLAAHYQKNGDFNLAIRYGDSSLRYYLLAGNKKRIKEQSVALCWQCQINGNFDKVKTIYQKAGVFFDTRDRNDAKNLSLLYQCITAMHSATGYYDSVSIYCIKIINELKIPDTNNYTIFIGAYNSLSEFSMLSGAYDKALDYLNKADDLTDLYRDTSNKVLVLNNKTELYRNLKKLKKAKIQVNEALVLSRKMNYAHYQSYSAASLAGILMEEEKPEEALTYSEEAYRSAIASQYFEDKINAAYGYANNYIQLKNYKKALQYLLPAIEESRQKGQTKNIAYAYNSLSTVYAGLGKYKKALAFKDQYAQIRDSILGKENVGHIAEIEAKYHVAQKDKELVQKQLQLERQQKQLYLGIGAGVLFTLLMLGLLRQRRHKEILSRLQASLEGEEKERTRLARELHDGIVSRLSVVKTSFSALPQHYQDEQEAEGFREAVRQLDQSIGELRTTSHNLLPEALQKLGLAESLYSYCEKICKTGQLEVDFQLIGEFPPLTDEFQLNIYRIVQELMQNILKHSGARHALLQLQIRESILEITLDDDGNETPAVTGHKGIGIDNVNIRVKYLNGSLDVERNAGTSIYLKFDLRKFIRKL